MMLLTKALLMSKELTIFDMLPEACRLKRTFMDHSSGHRAHWISNPAWRDGYGSLGGVNVTQAYQSRYDDYASVTLSAATSYRSLYVYFLEAQRYLLFTSSDGKTFQHTTAMGG